MTARPRSAVIFSTDGGFHTVTVLGEAQLDRYECFVDGVSQGVGAISDFNFSSTVAAS